MLSRIDGAFLALDMEHGIYRELYIYCELIESLAPWNPPLSGLQLPSFPRTLAGVVGPLY